MNLRQLVKYVLWRDATQHGEYRTFLKLMGPACPSIVVDVGANDGFYGSNSFPFVARDWRAILIEPHPNVFARLQTKFAGKPRVTCLNLACSNQRGLLPLFIGKDGDAGTLSTLCRDDNDHFRTARTEQSVEVRVEVLSEVLESQAIPRDFGLLSVDTEGMDYEVLLGLNLPKWRPRIIITEDYAPKDLAKFNHLREHGYRLRAHPLGNTIWSLT